MDKQEDEIFCPECAKAIKKDFTICPYCRTEIKNIIKDEVKNNDEFDLYKIGSNEKTNQDDNKKEWKPISTWKIVIGIVVVIGIIVLFMSCFNNTGNNSSTPTTKNAQSLEIEAFVRSQSVCEKYLKSPSSAKFPYYSSISVKRLEAGKYLINAYVDSQNSFGAMVRADYSVVITSTGKDTYTYEDFQLIE